MDFVIATKNNGKLKEFERILTPLGINCTAANIPTVEETGKTFEENALLKAKAACEATGLPSIGDDSGLMADALNGDPGIYSARYSGEHASDGKNTAKLLKNLECHTNRTARFVCAICCYFPDGSKITVTEFCEGTIAQKPIGQNGFGYDNVFLIASGKTFAQIDDITKDKLSHRGKALRALFKGLQNIL